jgi:hypothetical protein
MPLALEDIGRAFSGLSLPEPARSFQVNGNTTELISELGSNYARYHAFLASALAAIGSSPDPDGLYVEDHETYSATWGRIQRIIQAESILRMCRRSRMGGSLKDGPDLSAPFVDDSHRLISVESGRADSRLPEDPAAKRAPAPMPDWANLQPPALRPHRG